MIMKIEIICISNCFSPQQPSSIPHDAVVHMQIATPGMPTGFSVVPEMIAAITIMLQAVNVSRETG